MSWREAQSRILTAGKGEGTGYLLGCSPCIIWGLLLLYLPLTFSFKIRNILPRLCCHERDQSLLLSLIVLPCYMEVVKENCYSVPP